MILHTRGTSLVATTCLAQRLRQMVIMSGELGRARARVMYEFVSKFGASAYESENTGDYAGAEKLMHFRRRAK